MNAIGFAPMWAAEGTRGDCRHLAAAKTWCKSQGAPPPILFDNRQPRYVRTKTVYDALLRQNTGYTSVALFGYGGATGLQSGFTLESVERLSQVLLSATSRGSTIEICCLDPYVDTSGVAEDGGFAQRLFDTMRLSGRWEGSLLVKASDSDHQSKARLFQGAESIWLTQ